MDAANDSKYHLMRGMIALAWADGVLDPGEQTLLERYIDSNVNVTAQQRAALKASIGTPLSIQDVWNKITDMRDRARLIDVAGVIFHADGDYSASEKEVYENMLAMHLAALSGKPTTHVQEMAEKAKLEARKKAILQEAEYKVEAKKEAPSKIGLLIYRINKAMAHS